MRSNLVTTTDRAAVGHFFNCSQYIDVAIPRGGEGLIRRVAAEAKMPVIKHFDGNCHVYVDDSADLEMAVAITVNSKCQRMGVCNACESLLVHAKIAERFLPLVDRRIAASTAWRFAATRRPANSIVEPSRRPKRIIRTEYLGPMISVKVVRSLDEAIEHINQYGSHHTDAIVTREPGCSRGCSLPPSTVRR